MPSMKVLIVGFVISFTLSGVVSARDKPAPYPGLDYPLSENADMARLSYDYEPNTPCIGDNTSAICAVVNYYACFAWARPDLCDLVGGESVRFTPEVQPTDRLGDLYFRVGRQKVLTPADIPDCNKAGAPRTEHLGFWEPWRPGDIATELEMRQCYPTYECNSNIHSQGLDVNKHCPNVDCPTARIEHKTIVMREYSDRWAIVYAGMSTMGCYGELGNSPLILDLLDDLWKRK